MFRFTTGIIFQGSYFTSLWRRSRARSLSLVEILFGSGKHRLHKPASLNPLGGLTPSLQITLQFCSSFHSLLKRLGQGAGEKINLTSLMVFSHQSKTTTRQRQDKCWTCAFLWCLSHQVCRTWCERHHRNAQVQHLSCHCLVVVLSLSCSGVKTPLQSSNGKTMTQAVSLFTDMFDIPTQGAKYF